MTDEVSRLVLTDNVDQNDLMGGTSRANAAALLNVHARQIVELEERRGSTGAGGVAVEKGDPSPPRGRNRAELTGTGDPDGAREAVPQG